jgi:hypothetical protein
VKQAIAEFLSSKKALAYLSLGVVVIGNKLVGHFGYELDASQVALIVGAGAAYIVGQGLADHGKEAAAISAKAFGQPQAQIIDKDAS